MYTEIWTGAIGACLCACACSWACACACACACAGAPTCSSSLEGPSPSPACPPPPGPVTASWIEGLHLASACWRLYTESGAGAAGAGTYICLVVLSFTDSSSSPQGCHQLPSFSLDWLCKHSVIKICSTAKVESTMKKQSTTLLVNGLRWPRRLGYWGIEIGFCSDFFLSSPGEGGWS